MPKSIRKKNTLWFGILIIALIFISLPTVSLRADSPPGESPSSSETNAANNLLAVPSTLNYRLDAGQSRFIVRAFVGGLLSAFGHNHTISIRNFSGNASLTTDTLSPASLQMTIKADSLTVIDKISAKDKQEIETKMRNEVLETGQHPNIVFKSTNITGTKTAEGQYDLQIWGDVTLHGVSKNIWFKGQLSLGENILKAKGEFTLRMSEFNIKQVTAAGGTVKVKDELKFSFDIVGVK